MTLYSYVAPFDSGFRGNPNASISAITTSGGIACSRTSGQTPCFIQVSASAITASGTSVPYEDLDYSWDFGDDDSTETFTNPGVGGGTVNSNDGQTGPEAVHCYRTAGTYTITLTIRGNRSSGHVLATVTQEITVTTFSASGGEYWFDSVAGDDGNDGLSSGAPKQTLSALNTVLAATSNLAVHIKRGSSYTGTVSLAPWATDGTDRSGLRIDAYGSGALPKFDISSGENYPVTMWNGGASSPSAKDDIVLSNLHFTISGTATAGSVIYMGAHGHASATVSNLYFDNCTAEATVINAALTVISSTIGASGNTKLTKIGHWKTTVISPASSDYGCTGIFASPYSWFFVVGGSITGGTSGVGAQRHHIYPGCREHSLFRWIDFGAGENRNYCINLDFTPSGGFDYGQYVLMSGNEFTGTDHAHDLSNSNNNPAESLFKNVVCEKNRIHGLLGGAAIIFYAAESYTHRDNEIWGYTAGRYYEPDNGLDSILTSRLYRNKMHIPSDVNASDFINLIGSTIPITFTDNIIVDLRSTSRMITVLWSGQAGATIDRNQYYTPNDGGANGWRDGATEKTFAQWQTQGYDANGTVADPGWTDPANGDFS